MTTVRVERRTGASAASCWQLMADFGQIDFFNPHLQGSHVLKGSRTQGLGAERQCDLTANRGSIRERVIDWQEGEGYTVEITRNIMPVTGMQTRLSVRPAGTGSVLVMETRYRPGWGAFGWALDLALRPMLAHMLRGVLKGLAEKAERRPELAAAA